MVRKNVSCDYHRIQLPAETMGINIDVPTQSGSLDIFCRTQELPIDKFLAQRGERKLIVDIDDYWHLYPHHYLFGIWSGNHTADKIIQAMKIADIVTTTNEALAQRISIYNKNYCVLPNALPFDAGQFQRGDMSGKAAFFWAGGASHGHDLNILRAIMTNMPYDLTLMGDDGGGQWAKIKASFAGRAKYIRMLPVDSYMTGYQGNVMLAPLENNFFNQHKSNLKILEAGCKGMAVIASRMPPYYNEKDKPFVMYADSPGEWQAHIKYCIANPGFVHEIGAALAEHVRTHYDLNNINKIRKQVYGMLL